MGRTPAPLALRQGDSASQTPTEVDVALKLTRKAKIELETEILAEKYVPRETYEAHRVALCDSFTRALVTACQPLPLTLAGLDGPEIEKRLHEWRERVRADLRAECERQSDVAATAYKRGPGRPGGRDGT